MTKGKIMTANILYLDLETRSQCDLIFHGLARYAQDPTTEVICMAWAFNTEEVELWWADTKEPFPQRIIDHIKEGGLIVAHNAAFERHLFEWVICPDYAFNAPRVTQWRCSMVTMLANGCPAGLDSAARAMGVQYQKSSHGTRLIREYCAPGFATEFLPGDRELMGDYCVYDVKVMRELLLGCRDLTAGEWEEYALNEKINDRGLPVDVELCEAAMGYAREIADDANKELAALTGGKVTKYTQRKERDAWLFPKLTAEQMKLLTVYKKGEKKTSLDQDHRTILQDCDDLDPDARYMLEQIDNGGSSSLKKYAVAAHQHVDGRVHNCFLFNGAGQTGRFSGKGLQTHNMVRECYSDNEAAALIADIKEGIELDQPSRTMARLARAMIYSPEGLYWVDWSAIEGRVAPWLCGDMHHALLKLHIFRANRDVYKITACDMFHVPEPDIDDAQRQSGKIAELSLQFGGGHGALLSMARKYGEVWEEDYGKDIVARWRRANPWAETIWSDYDKAISAAVKDPGEPYPVGRVTFQSDGEHFLWCELPSGRLLSYPRPRWEVYTTPWGEERVGATFQTHFKPPAGEPPLRRHARGALLFQNSVQAVAADILREALLEADDAGLDIVAHCHDELIGQGPPEEGHLLNEIMLQQPRWAEGLPLATGGVRHSTRWGK
jgi:DNA polymerase bacteriophage-type